MLEFDPATGMLGMPVWWMAAFAAVIVVLAAFSVFRAGAARPLVSIAAVGVLCVGGWLALSLADRTSGTNTGVSGSDRLEERRLFEARVNEFTARAMMPGSPLACLDGNAGDQVAAGCEKLVFGSADTIAASVSYVSTRIALLNEGTELAAASGLSYDKPLSALRRGLEADPYGIVAQVLLQNPDCKAERCESLAMLRDPNKVRVNLLEKPFDVLVMRYAANWPSGTRAAAGSDNRGAVMAAPGAPPPPPTSGQGVPVSSKYDFPSSASIPPVSIMNAEPTGQPQAKSATAAEAPAPARNAAAPAAAKKPPPKPAPRREAAAPTQLAPAGQPAAQERPQQ